MADRNGVERVINVAVCKRIGDKESILVCKRCYNEVEGSVDRLAALGGGFDHAIPRYNYCPWCSAPLKEVDNG